MDKQKQPKFRAPRCYLVLAIAWVVVDQLVKLLVRHNILYRDLHPFLPGLDLTYVRNTGAAFSMLSSHTWFLALLSAVVGAALAVALARDFLPHWRGRLALALMLGGGCRQPHRPGSAGLRHRHVCHQLYQLCRVQRGGHRGGRRRHPPEHPPDLPLEG